MRAYTKPTWDNVENRLWFHGDVRCVRTPPISALAKSEGLTGVPVKWFLPFVLVAHDTGDRDGRLQLLPLGGLRLEGADDVHALDIRAKGGNTLPVGVALPPEVQFRLVIDADEELGDCAIRRQPRHGYRAITMRKPGFGSSLQRNRRTQVVFA